MKNKYWKIVAKILIMALLAWTYVTPAFLITGSFLNINTNMWTTVFALYILWWALLLYVGIFK